MEKKQRFRGFFCEQLQEASLYKSMFKKNTKSRLSVSPYFLCSLSTTSVVKLRDRQLICTMSKNHRRKHFLRSWLKSKVAQWPRFRRTGWCDLRSDLRRHPRPKFAKIVILSSLKDDHFFIPEGPHLRPFEAAASNRLLRPPPQIRPPRPSEAVSVLRLGSDLRGGRAKQAAVGLVCQAKRAVSGGLA